MLSVESSQTQVAHFGPDHIRDYPECEGLGAAPVRMLPIACTVSNIREWGCVRSSEKEGGCHNYVKSHTGKYCRRHTVF